MLRHVIDKISFMLSVKFADRFNNFDVAFAELKQQYINMHESVSEIKRTQTLERLEKYLLAACADPLMQRGITKEFLRSVEIGIHSFCNRRCWFCANGDKVDRHSNKIVMPDEVFLKIINELAEIGYTGGVSFHRFNEPLADRELIIKRLSQVKTFLPQCHPAIYTNGDYINDSRYLLELIQPNKREWIYISLYLDKNESFFDKNIISAKFENFFARVKLDHTQIYLNEQENRYECSLTGPYCGKVTVVVPNFEQHAYTMAGAVETGRRRVRTEPCSQPFGGLWIDYHGYVMPCCMMRYDVEEHKYATLGNVHDKSIFELFCSKEMSNFRKQLKNYGPKNSACKYCDMHGEWMEKWAPIY